MPPSLSTPPRVLVADDQPDVLEALRLLLSHAGFEATLVSSPEAILSALERDRFDVLLMDLNYTRDTTSGREGLDLLSRIRRDHDSLPIVVMTGWGTVDVAVEAMREGVRDFVQKPWDNAHLVEMLARETEESRSRRHRIREVEEAQIIQRRLLPESLPQIDGWRLEGRWYPASSSGVAGDFFDAIMFDRTRVGVCIADVTGKGIPAALLMSNLQAAFRAFAGPDTPPDDLCARLNGILCPNVGNGRFVSFFYGVLDAGAGRFTYCNAGHPAPMLVRADGRLERLSGGGLVLGVFSDISYKPRSVAVGTGDCIVLYTDGVTEAGIENGEEFGEERLAAELADGRALDAGLLANRVVDAARAFAREAPQDDVTIVVLAADGR